MYMREHSGSEGAPSDGVTSPSRIRCMLNGLSPTRPPFIRILDAFAHITMNAVFGVGGFQMKLLLKREQSLSQRPGPYRAVTFKLWAQAELDDEEKLLVKRYKFEGATLIEVDQPNHLRNAVFVGIGAALVAFVLIVMPLLARVPFNWVLALGAGAAAGYLYYDRKRETVLVRDLIHGRHFACDSVVDLAKKEAWLAEVAGILRAILEKAKNWGGTEIVPIEPPGKDTQTYIALKAL